MSIRFTASQSVAIAIPKQPVPIQHYLRQPQRLIKALVDVNRMEQLSSECFRLKMRPLSFMMLSIQPTVDLQVWTATNGTIYLKSVSSEIRGIEYINQRFNLNLMGHLTPVTIQNITRLQGRADLEVQVEVPPPLLLTPKPLLEATGNGLLHSVLVTIKQRLMHQLVSDYCKWTATQTYGSHETQSQLLSPNSPLI